MTTKNGPPTLATPQKITPRDSAPSKVPQQSTPAKGVQKVDDKANEATARNLQANIQKQRTISTTQGPKAIEPKVTDGKDGKVTSQKPPPIEPVRPILLKQILSDEGMNLVFQQFAEANKFENDVSNIKFYSLVERFKKLPRGDVQLQKARALYDMYIKPGAKMQISVPIPADHLQTIEKQINSKVSRSLYDRIQELISFQVEPIMEKLREDTVAYKNCELEGILLNPTRSLLFLRFAKDMYCEENVMFYLDIYRLEKNLKHARSLPAVVGDEYKDQNTLLCENILQKYVLNRAEYQLDIPETTRSQILKEMKQLRKTGQVTKTLFEQARLRVLEKMRWDMLEPFIKAEQESLDGSDEEEDDEDDDLDELGPSHLELPSPAIPSSTPSSHMSGFFERSASADQLTLSDKLRKHGGSTSMSHNGDPTSPTLPAKDIIRPMNPLAKTPTKDSIHFPVPLSPLTPTLESQTPQKVPKSNSFDRKGLSLTPWLIDRRRSVSAADLYSVKQIIARGRKLSADLDPSGGSPLSASSGGSVVPSPISSSTPRSLNDWNHGFFSSIRMKTGGLAQPALARFSSSPEPSTTRFVRSNSKDGVSVIRGSSDESPVGTPPTDYAGSTPKLAPRNLMQRLEITPEDSGSGSRTFPIRSVGLAALREEDEEIAFTTPSNDTNSPPLDPTENNFPDQKMSPIVQPASSPLPISTDSASSSTPTSSSTSLLSSLPRLELDLEFDRPLPSSLQSSDSADSVGSDAYRFQALQREREEYQQIAYQLVIMDRSCRGLAIRPRFLHSVDDLELDHLKKMGVVPDFKTSKYNILAGLRRRSVKISPLLSGQSINNQITKEGWLEDPPGLRRSSSGNSTSSNGSNGSFSGITASSTSGSEVKGGLTITKTLYGSSSSPLSTPRIKGGKKSKSGIKSPGRQTPLSSPLNRKGPRVHFAFDDGVASPKPKPIILAPQPEVDEEGLALPSNPISLTASSPTNQDSPELHTHPSDLDFSGSGNGNGMISDKNERTPQRKSALKRRSDMLLSVSNGVGATVAPTHFFPPTTSTLSASMEAHRGSKIGHARPVTTREGDGVRVRQETFEELIKRVFAEREQESTRLLKVLSEGALLTKFSPMGKGSQRWFAVSKDGTEMLWSKVDKKKGTKRSSLFNRPKKRYLAEVMRIRYGSRWSRRFFRYNHKGRPPWLCFTVVLPDRTLDIVCENEQQVTTWFLGLQSLAPLSQCYLSVGALLWCRARMKVKYRARNQRLKETQVLDQLLAEARAAVRKEKEGLSPGTMTAGTPSTTLTDPTPGLPTAVPTPRISPRASSSSFFPTTRPPSTSNSIVSSSSSSSSSVTPSLTVPSPLSTPSSSTTPNLPVTGASPTTPARRSFLSFAFHSNHSTSSSSSSTSPPTITPSSTSASSSSSASTSQLPTPRSLLMVT